MEKESIAILADAEIPGDLKSALKNYNQAFEELKPSLRHQFQMRLTYWMEQLFKEASDPQLETHWWESMLFLTAKYVEPLGDAARPLLEAGEKLAALLRDYLGPYQDITLREITEDTVLWVCFLTDTLDEPQKFMVAPNAFSLAQALVNPKAWYRAIYAGKALVGFLMLYDDEQEPAYFLWRLMISSPCQGRGYAAEAIQRLVEYVRTRPNARELGVSCVEGEGSPKGFYEKVGFVSTGEYDGGELVMKMNLE